MRAQDLDRSVVAAAVLTVLALAALVTWSVLVDRREAPAPTISHDHVVTGLSAYEKRVLTQVPQSYAVDGTVVLPDRAAPGAESDLSPGVRLTGTPVRLGFHGTIAPGFLRSATRAAPYQQDAPAGSQVVVDPGPLWLGCTSSRTRPGCTVAVLVRDTAGGLRFLYAPGSDHFLRPGAAMELFTDDDLAGGTWHATVIGGFHGTSAARVEVELVTGQVVRAVVDPGRLSRGSTLFWARLPAEVAQVRAYDAGGALLAQHRLHACPDPGDCGAH